MLLSHKDAIEFIVDAVPTYGINMTVICNVQSMLMNGLLANSAALGALRSTIVNISDTVYVPSQVQVLREGSEILKACYSIAAQTKRPDPATTLLQPTTPEMDSREACAARPRRRFH
jgi:hypothetical protein